MLKWYGTLHHHSPLTVLQEIERRTQATTELSKDIEKLKSSNVSELNKAQSMHDTIELIDIVFSSENEPEQFELIRLDTDNAKALYYQLNIIHKGMLWNYRTIERQHIKSNLY